MQSKWGEEKEAKGKMKGRQAEIEEIREEENQLKIFYLKLSKWYKTLHADIKKINKDDQKDGSSLRVLAISEGKKWA